MQLSCYNYNMAKSSKAQAEILNLLQKNHLLSAVEIYTLLQKNGIKMNKTTVYRALEKLLKEGEICRHSLGENTILYEIRTHHHAHAVCEKCGKVQSIDTDPKTTALIENFTVTHEHKTVFGVCSSCLS